MFKHLKDLFYFLFGPPNSHQWGGLVSGHLLSPRQSRLYIYTVCVHAIVGAASETPFKGESHIFVLNRPTAVETHSSAEQRSRSRKLLISCPTDYEPILSA